MSEDNRTNRPDYRVSVEAGLRRLESEKLSFLGSSKVISKFDPDSIEEFSQIDEEEDEDVTLHEAIQSGELLEGSGKTLDDFRRVQSGECELDDEDDEDNSHVIRRDESLFKTVDSSSGVQSVSDIASVFDSRTNTVPGADNPYNTMNFAACRDDDADDIDSNDAENDSQSEIDAGDTKDVCDIAADIRADNSSEEDPELEYGETKNVTDIAEEIRNGIIPGVISGELESCETHDVSDIAAEIRSKAAAKVNQPDLESCETHDVSDVAAEIRSKAAAKVNQPVLESCETHDVSDIAADIRNKTVIAPNSAELDSVTNNVDEVPEELRKTGLVIPDLDPELAETHDVSSIANELRLETAETHNVSNIAKELRLETAETVDVGKQAMLVREALKKGEGAPTAQVMKRGVRPADRPKEPEAAIDRLKEQGLFNPVPIVHHEVNKNLENIQDLDKILPKSDVKTWDGEFVEGEDSNERTMAQNPNAIDELRQVAKLVKAVHAAEIKPEPAKSEPQIAMIPGCAGVDIESRETIPIDLTQLPPDVLGNVPVKTKSQKRHSSAQLEAADAGESVDEEELEKQHLGLWVALIAVLLCGIVYMLYLMGAFASISPALDPYSVSDIEVNENVNVISYSMEEVSSAIDVVAGKFDAAADFDSWIGPWLEKMINQQSSPEAQIPYLQLEYDCFSHDPEKLQRLIETCIVTGKNDIAREYLSDKSLSADFVSKMNMKMLLNDPKFLPEVQTLTEDICDTIDPLGGGSTLTFKMKLKGVNVGAFKPLQTRKQSNYRSEIAAWRLCELIECDFSIPWNRPIRIEHALFDTLFSRSNSKKKTAYRSELNDIIWTKEDGKTFVYGTLKDWVPEFTRFPIELTSFWKNWLSMEDYIDEFKPLAEALSPLKRNAHTQKLYTELMEQSPDLTTPQLAAQVSEVLVFDYLIGNWDRFSGVPDWWGVNCQFKDNKIVSIDNGAGFPSYSNDKVRDRFMMVERFSAHFIEALRGLDKEQTFKVLFPEPSKRETECFEQFWKQRASVLSRVEKLSEQYGVEKVLSL